MRKVLYIIICSALTTFVGDACASMPPRGDVLLTFGNGSGRDLLVDSECRKAPGDPYIIPQGAQTEIPLFFSGNTCKVIAIDANNPKKQAVLCLDPDACEIHCNDAECAGGVCDNIGMQWIRGCGAGCFKFSKPGLKNTDTCIRSGEHSINYGVVHRDYNDELIAKQLFNGGDISDYLNDNIGADNATAVISKIGIAQAPDFANAVWKFTEINAFMKNDKFKKAFCSIALKDPQSIALLHSNPGDYSWLYKLKTQVCADQDGYVPNAPGYQIKCSNGAKFSYDASACECINPSTTLMPLHVDKPAPAGIIRAHWGCQ